MVFVVEQIYLFVNVHAQLVELIDISIPFLDQPSDLNIFVALLNDKVLQLCLLLFVLCENIKVLHFHGFVVLRDFLNIFLSLLVLAELPDQNLVVILKLPHLFAFLLGLRDSFEFLLQIIDSLVPFFKLSGEEFDFLCSGCHLSYRPNIALGLTGAHFNSQVRHQRLAEVRLGANRQSVGHIVGDVER